MHKLILIRHGDAEYGSPDGSDASRQLSAKGLHDIKLQAKFLQAAGQDLEVIYHSPFVRAVQTATILADLLQLPLLEEPALRPSGEEALLENALLGLKQPAIFVSHLPIIAEFARSITGENIRFMPGTMAKIDRKDVWQLRGRVHWIQHPDNSTSTILN